MSGHYNDYMCLADIWDGLCVERPVSGMRGPEMDLKLHGHNPLDPPLPRNPSEPPRQLVSKQTCRFNAALKLGLNQCGGSKRDSPRENLGTDRNRP